MKVDLGDNFIFELLKGDLKDIPIQEAVAKKVFVSMAIELEDLKNKVEDEKFNKSVYTKF